MEPDDDVFSHMLSDVVAARSQPIQPSASTMNIWSSVEEDSWPHTEDDAVVPEDIQKFREDVDAFKKRIADASKAYKDAVIKRDENIEKQNIVDNAITSLLSIGGDAEALSAIRGSLSLDVSNQEVERLFSVLKVAQTAVTSLRQICPNGGVGVCPVCMERTVSRVNVPCGHAICESCVIRGSKCCVCRGTIASTLRIYI